MDYQISIMTEEEWGGTSCEPESGKADCHIGMGTGLLRGIKITLESQSVGKLLVCVVV